MSPSAPVSALAWARVGEERREMVARKPRMGARIVIGLASIATLIDAMPDGDLLGVEPETPDERQEVADMRAAAMWIRAMVDWDWSRRC